MQDTIRVRLSPQATAELLKIMQVYGTESPGHAINKLVNKLYKQLRLNEDKSNEQDSTIC